MRPVRSWRDVLTVVGFLTPALVLLAGFTIWPAVWAIYQSFTNKALTGFEARSPRFVGLENYTRLLGDPDFHSSMLRTFAFVLLSAVIGQTIFAFLIAYLMADRPRWRPFDARHLRLIQQPEPVCPSTFFIVSRCSPFASIASVKRQYCVSSKFHSARRDIMSRPIST